MRVAGLGEGLGGKVLGRAEFLASGRINEQAIFRGSSAGTPDPILEQILETLALPYGVCG